MAGCSEASNGIAPFGKCAVHYRAYMEWLAGRTRLESFLTLCLRADDLTTPARDQPAGVWVEHVLDGLQQQAKDDEIVGAVLDHIGFVAARSIYASRQPRKTKGTREHEPRDDFGQPHG